MQAKASMGECLQGAIKGFVHDADSHKSVIRGQMHHAFVSVRQDADRVRGYPVATESSPIGVWTGNAKHDHAIGCRTVDTALPSPVVGTGHFIRTYHGERGTFTIQLQTLLKPTDVPWLFTETGRWVITDADRDYEGLLGQGEESGVRDFSAQKLDAVLTGKVHFDATKASSRVTTTEAAAPTLTVTNGSGSGQHVAGTIVTVTADPPPLGKRFAGWTGDVQILANPSLSTTTATIPSVDVTLSATLR